MSENLSSAAVVIGALRVKISLFTFDLFLKMSSACKMNILCHSAILCDIMQTKDFIKNPNKT